MKIVIDISKDDFEKIKNISFVEDTETMLHQSSEDRKSTMMLFRVMDAIKEGTPLPEHLNKIKEDIGRYELDCRFADYSQTDACTICNKNVFESIYRIIDNRLAESEGSDSE